MKHRHVRFARLGGLALALAAFAGPSRATDFSDALAVDASTYRVWRLVEGDVDGDGDVDLVSSTTSGTLVAHLNADGAGHAWHSVIVGVISQAVSGVDLADIDGDGDLDVGFVSIPSGPTAGAMYWAENTAGDASAWDVHLISTIAAPVRTVSLGDLDGDDDVDFIWSLGDGKGWAENDLGDGSSWTLKFITTGPSAYTYTPMTLVDLDEDDDLDIVYGSDSPSQVVWLENLNGDATTWDDHGLIFASFVTGISPGDYDDDGDIDVLISSQNGVGFLAMLTNPDAPPGVLWSSVTIASGDEPSDCELVDVDGDGDLDAVTISGFGDIEWLENGNGWFAHGVGPTIGTQGDTILAADIDSDGDIDLAAPDYEGDRVLWWEQLTWFDEGAALAGALGEPKLVGSGKLLPGETVLFSLTDALPFSTASFVVGLSELSAPFKGGTLVPNLDVVLNGIPTSFGIIGLPVVWPEDVPAGTEFWYQMWISDPGGPTGFAATNAVRSITP